MPIEFSPIVTEYWLTDERDSSGNDELRVRVDERLRDDLVLTLLSVVPGPRIITVKPEAATALSLADGGVVGADEISARLRAEGFELHGADHLFYLPLQEQQSLLSHPNPASTRRLTSADAAEFERFCADAPADDLDEAFVEIDHWLVYGTFVEGEMVAAASAYSWHDSQLADIGVITLPAFRGRGLAKRVVKAIAKDVLSRGREPQYRCQLENVPSTALATSAGFARFGEWDVVVAD